jgi:hemin uptake protein HemP
VTTERALPNDRPDERTAVEPAARDAVGSPPRVVSSDTLLAGGSQLAILHRQTTYFLRQTRFGKLILTK